MSPVPTPIQQVKAEFFKALAHPARIRVLEILRGGERSVAEILTEVDLQAPHLSQQLGVMRRAGLIRARKVGTNVYYSVTDPDIFELLEVAKRIIRSSLIETRDLLDRI
jgi:DNA-binding transcriptional ArsR family regulator